MTQDHGGAPELAPGTAEVLQAATRMLAGAARALGNDLPAAHTAAVVLGAFRESAFGAMNLAQIAAQISTHGREIEILNCGHPPLLVGDGDRLIEDVHPMPVTRPTMTPRCS